MTRRSLLPIVDRRSVLLAGVAACTPRALRDEHEAFDDASADARIADGALDRAEAAQADAVPSPAPGGGFCVIGAGALGPPSGFPLGTWTLDRAHAAIVGHDAAGLFAMTAYCSHAGCLVNDPALDGETLCACHLSRFDGSGNVLAGPATRPLVHLALTLCAGSLVVDHATVVTPSTRLVPPADPTASDAGVSPDGDPADAAPGPNRCSADRVVDKSGATDDGRMIMVPTTRPAFNFPCMAIAVGQSITFMFDLAMYPIVPGLAPSRVGLDPPGTEPSPIVATSGGAMYRVAFTAPGVYPFYCPTYESQGMYGAIEVR